MVVNMENREGLRQKKYHIKTLLSEAITMLCKNSIQFDSELTVEGLIGITVDEEEVVLINVNEVLHGKEAASRSVDSVDDLNKSSLRSLLKPGVKEQVKKVSEGKELDGYNSDGGNSEEVMKAEVKSEAAEKGSQPKRKQRRPMQYKERMSALESGVAGEEESWDGCGGSYCGGQADGSKFEGRFGSSKNCRSGHEQEFVVLERDGSLQIADKNDVPSASSSPESAFVKTSPPEKYGHDFGRVLSFRSESTILSVPSPKSIYAKKCPGSFERNEVTPSSRNDPKAEMAGDYLGGVDQDLSDNENESESSLALSNDQLTFDNSQQRDDLPMDLSVESPISLRTNNNRSQLSPPKTEEDLCSQGVIRCPECRKWFDSRIKYNRHKRSHRGIFTCKVCGRAYNRKDNMQRHYKLYHTAFYHQQQGDLDDISTFKREAEEVRT